MRTTSLPDSEAPNVVSLRLKPGYRRWLARLAADEQSSPGRIALAELEKAIDARVRALLQAAMDAELSALRAPPKGDTPDSFDDGATSPTLSPETEAAHDAG